MSGGNTSAILEMEQGELVGAGLQPLPALGQLVSSLTYLPGDVPQDEAAAV